MFHIDCGSLHHIENLSDSERCEFLVCFRHEKPEDFSLGGALGAMTPAVLGNTYNVPAAAFSQISLSTENKYIIAREGESASPTTASLSNPHKFDVDGMKPTVEDENIGNLKPARAQFWPALRNIAMYSLRVENQGIREPHWHPNTAEMGYVIRGEGRMTIMDPDGSTDTFTLKAGDMYFVPPAYPHQIEVLPNRDEGFHFCIFFDQPTPQDIGYKTSLNAMPYEAIAATFGISRKDMPNLQGTEVDPLLVVRLNEVDDIKSWTNI